MQKQTKTTLFPSDFVLSTTLRSVSWPALNLFTMCFIDTSQICSQNIMWCKPCAPQTLTTQPTTTPNPAISNSEIVRLNSSVTKPLRLYSCPLMETSADSLVSGWHWFWANKAAVIKAVLLGMLAGGEQSPRRGTIGELHSAYLPLWDVLKMNTFPAEYLWVLLKSLNRLQNTEMIQYMVCEGRVSHRSQTAGSHQGDSCKAPGPSKHCSEVSVLSGGASSCRWSQCLYFHLQL